MGGEQQIGIFHKYDVVRTDGTSAPGKKHGPSPNQPLGCQYFVLDLTHDPYARAAILAYANACMATHPVLSKDLSQLARRNDLFKGGRT